MEAPLDWELTGFGGDSRSGSIRLDCGADNMQRGKPIGLEIRWSEPGKEQSEEMLRKNVDSLLKSIEKKSKREKTPAQTSMNVSKSGKDDRPNQLSFQWSSGNVATGRIWWCKTCGRVVIAQVYGSGGARFLSLSSELLASIGCHGDKIGWRTWGLYGLLTEIPAECSLDSKQVMTIYVQLVFGKKRSDETLSIEQWSLANIQLKDSYLDEWLIRKAGVTLKNVRYEKSEDAVGGHPALYLTGKRSGLAYWLTDGIQTLLRFKLPPICFEALVWECPASNKIYMAHSFSARRSDLVVRDVANRTVCHIEEV